MFSSESTRKFFSSLAETENVSVIYNRNIEEPRSFKGGKVVLPPPNEILGELWEGLAHKEVSYLYSENKWLLEDPEIPDKDQSPGYSTAKRIINDHIAERNRYGEYEGRDRALTKNRGRIIKELQEQQPQLVDSGVTLDNDGEMIKSLLEWDLKTRKEFMGYEVKIQKDFAKGALSSPNFDNLLDSSIMKLRSQADLDNLLKALLQLEPTPPQQQQQQQQKKGETEDKRDLASDSEENSERDSEENSKGDFNDENIDKKPVSTLSPSIVDNHHGTGGGNTDESEDHKDHKEPIVPLNLKEVAKRFKDTNITKDSSSLLQSEKDFKRKHKKDYATQYIPISKTSFFSGKKLDERPHSCKAYGIDKNIIQEYYNSSTISRQIKKYLQAISQESYLYGQRKGKLCNRSISRIYCKQQQPKVFKKKHSSMLNCDTAITLLQDCSGSMNRVKYNIAAACCLSLSDTLHSINITHEILGFTSHEDNCYFEFKKFGENIAIEKLTNRLTSGHLFTGCNSDGDALAFAAERLLSRPEKSKVLIVLSDGQPAGKYIGDGKVYLKSICKKIEEKTPIKLFGIGICSTAVRRYYKSNSVISDPKQLDKELMLLLKSQVLK